MDMLHGFDFYCSEAELKPILENMRMLMPDKHKIDNCIEFDLVEDKSWFDIFDCYEFCDFYKNKNVATTTMIDLPHYYKWFNDCLWILNNHDVAVFVNIFLFNGDDNTSISDFISVKFKKKIGVDTLGWYKKLFWDCGAMDAKTAYTYYTKFMNTAYVVRHRLNGGVDLGAQILSADNACDEPIVFNTSAYIKWKAGYRNIEVPSAKDFAKRVMQDSYFKYEEAMTMTQSVEEMSEIGSNDKIGAYNSDRTVRRNVEEQRLKLAKAWSDLFIKASSHVKESSTEENDFFSKMNQLTITYVDEKIVAASENPKLLDDIRQDM